MSHALDAWGDGKEGGAGDADRLRRLIGPAVQAIDDPSALRELLQAVLEVGSGLDLAVTLQSIVDVAATVLDAQYGALGVRGPENELSAFVYTGLAPHVREAMGPLPVGKGVLGELMNDPRVLRIDRLGDHRSSVGFPANHPPMDTFLGAPIIIRGSVFGSIYMTGKRAGTFTERDESIVRVMSTAAAIAVDNAQLFEAAQTRHRWMQLVARRGSEPLAGIALANTLDHICADVAALSDAREVFILGVDDERATILGHTGDRVGQVVRLRSHLTHDAVPMTVVRAEELPELHRGFPDTSPAGQRWYSLVGLTRATGTFGLLVTVHDHNPHWRPEEQAGLSGVAEVTSLAVVYAEQQSLARDMEVLQDRHRIARDLHDHVIQRLFATGMSLQTLLASRPRDTSIIEPIGKVVTDLDGTVEHIRTAIFDLHSSYPAAQNSTTLRRRVLDTVSELTQHAPTPPAVRFHGPVDTIVPAALGPHIDAVLREGLSNALRHARARQISVTVSADEVMRVEIHDDGVGIAAGVHFSGLDNLLWRAEQCGGKFVIDSDGQGTTLIWKVPL